MENKPRLSKRIIVFWEKLEYWKKFIITEVIIILVSFITFPFFHFIFESLYYFIFKVLYTEYSMGAILFGAFGGAFIIIMLPLFITAFICYYLFVRKNKRKFSRYILMGLYGSSCFLVYLFFVLKTLHFDISRCLDALLQDLVPILVMFTILIFILNLIPPLWKQEKASVKKEKIIRQRTSHLAILLFILGLNNFIAIIPQGIRIPSNFLLKIFLYYPAPLRALVTWSTPLFFVTTIILSILFLKKVSVYHGLKGKSLTVMGLVFSSLSFIIWIIILLPSG